MNLDKKPSFTSIIWKVGLSKILNSVFSVKLSMMGFVTLSTFPSPLLSNSDCWPPHPFPPHIMGLGFGSYQYYQYNTICLLQYWSEMGRWSDSSQRKRLFLPLLDGHVESFEAWGGCTHLAIRGKARLKLKHDVISGKAEKPKYVLMF